MRQLGSVLLILGAIGVVVALFAAILPTIRQAGTVVSFSATSVSGPLVGGLILLLAGWWLRRHRAPAA